MGAVGNFEVVTKTVTLPASSGSTETISAPSGKVIFGAGMDNPNVTMSSAYPSADDEWTMEFVNNNGAVDVTIYATVAEMC